MKYRRPLGRWKLGLSILTLVATLGLACAPGAPPTPTPAPKPVAAPPTSAPQPPAKPTTAAAPAALEKITFRMSFTPSGMDVGWFTALEKGFYREQGLDIELFDGSAAQASLQQVGNQTVTFGFTDANVLAPGIVEGIPAQSVAAIVQKHPLAVIYREDSGIKTPKDLEGKQVGMTPAGTTGLLFPGFLKAAKVDANKVSVVNLDARILTTSLVENKIPAIASWWLTQGTLARLSGTKVNYFVFADYMENTYSAVLVANNKMVKEKPDLIRRYLAATTRGLEYAQAHPEEGADAVVKHRPALQRNIVLEQWKVVHTTFHTDRTRGKGIGWQAKEDWQATIAQVKQIGVLKKDVDLAQVYTNDFLPK